MDNGLCGPPMTLMRSSRGFVAITLAAVAGCNAPSCNVPNPFPMPMQEGHRPGDANQIALDPVTAKTLDAKLGDELLVLRLGAPVKLVVCGIVQRPMLGALQKPAVVVYRSTLNQAMGRDDEATQVAILLKPGTDVGAWCKAHSKDVVDDGTEGSSFVDLHREEIAKLGEKAGIAPVSSFAFARAVLKLATATEQDAKDTERLDYLLNNRSYVVSDETCCDGYWLLYVEPGGTWVQASEHSTPREAIDAAIAASKGGDK